MTNKKNFLNKEIPPSRLFDELLNQIIKKYELIKRMGKITEINSNLISFLEGQYFGFISSILYGIQYRSTISLDVILLKDKELILFAELNKFKLDQGTIKVVFNLSDKNKRLLENFSLFLMKDYNKNIYESFINDLSKVDKKLLIKIDKMINLIK
jgi:hypothetical protein